MKSNSMKYSIVIILTMSLLLQMVSKGLASSSANLFFPYVNFPVTSPYAVGIGDFNNDGRLDAAVTTQGNELKVFLQNMSGNLAGAVTYTTGLRPESVAVGDLNNDGRDDIVVANFNSNTIGVFIQQPDGTLASQVSYATGTGPDAVAVGDINGDGLDDVAVSNWNSSYISIFIQNSSGTLNTSINYASPQAGYDDIAIGDVNGDGLNDVVKMSGQLYANPDLSVYLQTGSGTLASAVSYSLPGNILGTSIGLGDVTGDGKVDVVMSYGGNRPNSNIAVFAQAADGSLLPGISYSAYDIPEAVNVADVNGDGLADVVAAHGGWNAISVFAQQANGTLGSYSTYPLRVFSASHFKPQALTIGDINSDGLPDVLVANSNFGLDVFYHLPVDITSPTVVSITRADPNPTSAASVNFTVSFSEAVTGVGLADFALSTTGTLANTAITAVNSSGSAYTVTVSTGTGSGTLRLDIPATAIIVDLAGNPLSGLPYTSGNSYTITRDLIPDPWVGSIVIQSDQSIVAVARPHMGSQTASYIGASAGSTTQYVPMLFKDAFIGGSYKSALYIQNLGNDPASLTIEFINDSGATVHTITEPLAAKASKGYWLSDIAGIPAGFAGGAKVAADQPLLAVGRPHIGAEMMSYNGMSAGSTTAWLPMFFKNAFGNYNTALYVQNITNASADLTIQFLNLDGTAVCEKADSLAANASKGYWSLQVTCDTGSLPEDFVGSAKVTSTQNILAVGRAHLGTQITTYNGFAGGAPTAYVPMLFKNAFGGGSYNAALYLQNVSGANANVIIEYVNNSGMVVATQGVSLNSGAIGSIWLPGVAGLPDGFVGGARISSTQDIVAVGRPHLGSEITAYNGTSGGSTSAYLPMLFKNAFAAPYNAAFYIQNVTANTANVNISFYDDLGTLSCVKTISLAPNATQGFWMPSVSCGP